MNGRQQPAVTSTCGVEYIELPTGHWPQLTKPAELARAILAAVDRS